MVEKISIIYRLNIAKIKGNIFAYYVHFSCQIAICTRPFQKQLIPTIYYIIYYIVTFYKIQTIYCRQRFLSEVQLNIITGFILVIRLIMAYQVISVPTRSKACLCGLLVAGICKFDSRNTLIVCLLRLSYVVTYKSMRWADPRVIQSVVC